MLTFVGEFRHSLDNKGRLIIPSRYRQSFGEKIYLCKGFEPCLLIVTPEEIEKIEKKVREDSLTNKAVRSFTRAFFSGMVDVGFDSQGRILIPANLREYAGIQEEAVVAGTGFYVEIWDRKAWEQNDLDKDRASIADFLEGIV